MIHIVLESPAREIADYVKEKLGSVAVNKDFKNVVAIDDGSDKITIVKGENVSCKEYNTDPLKIELSEEQIIPVKLKNRWCNFKVVNIDNETGLVWMLCTQPMLLCSSYRAQNTIWEAEFNIGLFEYKATRDGGNYIVLPTKKDIEAIRPDLAKIDDCYWLADEEYELDEVEYMEPKFENMVHSSASKEPIQKKSKFIVNTYGEIEEIPYDDRTVEYFAAPMIKFSLEYYEKALTAEDIIFNHAVVME